MPVLIEYVSKAFYDYTVALTESKNPSRSIYMKFNLKSL